ncbi:cation transporter [Muribacter muris]|uniref:Cation transporter n=1 Tax=Muribacter muris TaxID=67855 RepID=A0A4Y9JR23_9PAST|nr:cation diffusion facilitator family transporter [Muribacter muris]MBF0786057.1 cation transporter [Muribacter muris]MBF0827368.1 cation transporter [Muribacter muris]TFV08141.1 cation transporter [Muribacter muris]
MSHSHSHAAHNHHHDHHHIPQDKRTLLISFSIIAGFMLVEFVGGYWFNSLALMADAGHMANDALSLGLALLALWVSVQRSKVSQILAVVNGVSLLLIAGYIIWEAIARLQNPIKMLPLPMMAVAIIGLIVNIVVARLMLNADHNNLNIRAAYLHVLADLFGSIVAILSGLGAYLFDWQWIDPLASLLLSLIILRSGWQITQAAIVALKR